MKKETVIFKIDAGRGDVKKHSVCVSE